LVLKIPIIYVKDKQASRKDQGMLRLIGNPVFLARDMKQKGVKLIHIIDEDAKRGISNNLDIYDKLTFFINIEVECSENEVMVGKLLEKKVRVVLKLPAKTDLSKWKGNERLLVGIAPSGYNGNAEGVHDVIIEDADDVKVEKFAALGKRIIVDEADYRRLKRKKAIFGVLHPTC